MRTGFSSRRLYPKQRDLTPELSAIFILCVMLLSVSFIPALVGLSMTTARLPLPSILIH